MYSQLPFPNIKSSLIEALLLGFFIFLFLYIFQPFGTYNFSHNHKIVLLGIYGVISTLTHFILRFIIYIAGRKTWNFQKELLFLAASVLTYGFCSFIFHQIIIKRTFDFLHFPYFFLLVISVSIFPMGALVWNKRSKYYMHQDYIENHKTFTEILLKGTNKSEEYRFELESIFYVKSEGNYSKIMFSDNGHLQSRLLRSTLKQIQKQLPNSFFQTHRSYLVQLRKFQTLQKKSGKMVLFSEEPFIEIPVSESFQKSIKRMM